MPVSPRKFWVVQTGGATLAQPQAAIEPGISTGGHAQPSPHGR